MPARISECATRFSLMPGVGENEFDLLYEVRSRFFPPPRRMRAKKKKEKKANAAGCVSSRFHGAVWNDGGGGWGASSRDAFTLTSPSLPLSRSLSLLSRHSPPRTSSRPFATSSCLSPPRATRPTGWWCVATASRPSRSATSIMPRDSAYEPTHAHTQHSSNSPVSYLFLPPFNKQATIVIPPILLALAYYFQEEESPADRVRTPRATPIPSFKRRVDFFRRHSDRLVVSRDEFSFFFSSSTSHTHTFMTLCRCSLRQLLYFSPIAPPRSQPACRAWRPAQLSSPPSLAPCDRGEIPLPVPSLVSFGRRRRSAR